MHWSSQGDAVDEYDPDLQEMILWKKGFHLPIFRKMVYTKLVLVEMEERNLGEDVGVFAGRELRYLG